MNKNDQQFIAQKIRTKYMEKEATELDALRALDSKVKRPAKVFAYVFGTVSALIMGSGMSLLMSDLPETLGIANPILPGLILGIVGMLMAIVNYPIYKGILHRRQKKYAGRILELSEKIMNE